MDSRIRVVRSSRSATRLVCRPRPDWLPAGHPDVAPHEPIGLSLETRSWDASLAALAADFEQADLGGVEVLVEYQLPLSSKRVDVVLAGEHPRRSRPTYVVRDHNLWTAAGHF
ncbi:hypothetical protein ACI797_25810 [Geodermatophilus sp. SYSU D00691]